MMCNAKILSLLLLIAGIMLLNGCHPSTTVHEQVLDDSGQGKMGISEHMIVIVSYQANSEDSVIGYF